VTSADTRRILGLLVAALFLVVALCCGIWALVSRFVDGPTPTPETPEADGTALTVAYSPEMEQTFAALVSSFNDQRAKAPDGQVMVVRAVALDPEAMVNAVLDGSAEFQAITPDSSVWLGQLDQAWSKARGGDAAAVGETVRYAVSPVVIAMWEGLAREIGWPDRPISWQDLLTRAQQDPDFRWSHPSTNSTSGLLATLAAFYAGAGKTRGLTIEDVQAQSTLDYVAALEKTVRFYGEGNEPAIIERALAEGQSFLDAFVVQEQMVVYFNTRRPTEREKLVALYPAEGALWEDHPLALLETGSLTPYQRQVFAALRDYLLTPESQRFVLGQGFRPADVSVALDAPDSPLTAVNGVDPAEPKTALQIPSAGVIEVVRNVWWYTKRHTNVYLVADTSGSMSGEKLAQAQVALRAFLDQIQGDVERVGMVQFSTWPNLLVPLAELGQNRATLEAEVARLEAAGDTALLDAVLMAYRELQELGDTERINAIVAMTDGRENASSVSLRSLVRELQGKTDSLSGGNQVPVVIFCIAYGSDADMETLQAIAEATGGQVRMGDLETIQDLYKVLSTYF
jgi:Ca-activated chloride channel family protein